MADSTSHLNLISASQAQKEVTANALFNAMSMAATLGRDDATSIALTWGYVGGMVGVGGVPTWIANGTKTLTASVTNYLYLEADGTVTMSTSEPSGWPSAGGACAKALYEIVAGANSATSWTDYRYLISV